MSRKDSKEITFKRKVSAESSKERKKSGNEQSKAINDISQSLLEP